jgi:hypothetical protein
MVQHFVHEMESWAVVNLVVGLAVVRILAPSIDIVKVSSVHIPLPPRSLPRV